jgi:toxin ParE1/3/4
VLRIEIAASQLAEYPLVGRAGRVPGTRELLVLGTPYLLAYRVKADAIEILRVLHGARRWPRRM